MAEGVPGVDPNTPNDNRMALFVWFKKGGHGASLFSSFSFFRFSCLFG